MKKSFWISWVDGEVFSVSASPRVDDEEGIVTVEKRDMTFPELQLFTENNTDWFVTLWHSAKESK